MRRKESAIAAMNKPRTKLLMQMVWGAWLKYFVGVPVGTFFVVDDDVVRKYATGRAFKENHSFSLSQDAGAFLNAVHVEAEAI
jgi:hypothetical protein